MRGISTAFGLCPRFSNTLLTYNELFPHHSSCIPTRTSSQLYSKSIPCNNIVLTLDGYPAKCLHPVLRSYWFVCLLPAIPSPAIQVLSTRFTGHHSPIGYYRFRLTPNSTTPLQRMIHMTSSLLNICTLSTSSPFHSK